MFDGLGCFGCAARKQKAQLGMSWALAFMGLGDDLLSHGYDRTIIGATSFHGPVRDGKGWVQRAMVAKNSGVVRSRQWPVGERPTNGVGEVKR